MRAHEPSLIDPRAQRKLRKTIGIFAAIVLPFSLGWLGFALYIQQAALVAAGVVAVLFAGYLAILWARSATMPASSLATRAAIATSFAILGAVTAEPLLGVAMTMAAIIPPVLALVHVGRPVLLRLMLFGAATSAYAAIVPYVLPWSSSFPFPVDIVLPVTTLILAYAIFQMFLWNASGQLTETATELSAAMDLSREVSQTMDPQQVAKIIARHIAHAAEVADCTLSMWDRENDLVVTFASYPPGRGSRIAASYALADFPATRRVLMTGVPCYVDVADPVSDPDEIAYLRSVGQASMVILPLVVRGELTGILELTSTESHVFSDRSVQLAQLLAREAAFSLENARLYDEIHDQAFRDSLTGLANRSLFMDRLAHALDPPSGAESSPRDPFPRPRRLQGRQRQPGPRRGDRAPDRGQPSGCASPAPGGHDRPARRRRVRDPDRGRQGRQGARRGGPAHRRLQQPFTVEGREVVDHGAASASR